MSELDNFEQWLADLKEAEVQLFRLKCQTAHEALEHGAKSLAAEYWFYTTHSIPRLAALHRLMDERGVVIPPDVSLGMVWKAMLAADDRGVMDMHLLETLVLEGIREGWSPKEAQEAWAERRLLEEPEERAGYDDLGPGVIVTEGDTVMVRLEEPPDGLRGRLESVKGKRGER